MSKTDGLYCQTTKNMAITQNMAAQRCDAVSMAFLTKALFQTGILPRGNYLRMSEILKILEAMGSPADIIPSNRIENHSQCGLNPEIKTITGTAIAKAAFGFGFGIFRDGTDQGLIMKD